MRIGNKTAGEYFVCVSDWPASIASLEVSRSKWEFGSTRVEQKQKLSTRDFPVWGFKLVSLNFDETIGGTFETASELL